MIIETGRISKQIVGGKFCLKYITIYKTTVIVAMFSVTDNKTNLQSCYMLNHLTFSSSFNPHSIRVL